MKGDVETSNGDKRPSSISWTDAMILGAAVFGILLGLSMLSFEAAIVVGLLFLGFVVFKLLFS